MVRGLGGGRVYCMGLWLCTGHSGCISMGLEEGHVMIEDVPCVMNGTLY